MEHSNSWHSPRDKQSSILSQSCSSGTFTLLLVLSTSPTPSHYTVGWICTLATELVAVRAMLGERHNSLLQDCRNHNNYTLGRIGPDHVAIAEGTMGVTSVARVVEQMLWTFTALWFGLMVGIGGEARDTQNLSG